MTEAWIGTTLAGKYLIKQKIGAGGMGAVYVGEHIEIGKRVAIKVIEPQFAASEEMAQRFRREARAASAVESDHIVQVFDVGQDPQLGLYMVMEFLTGHDLSERLRHLEGPLPVSEAVSIALQVARALAKAHAAGVVHRDLKPANIFLTQREDGTTHAKILDFGISKLTRDDQNEPVRKGLTCEGSVIGTPQYMSPEQAQGLRVDLRADVWSLGAVLYEALSGTSAYEERASYEMTIIQIVTTHPRPLAEIAPWIPAPIAQVVHDALTHDVASRIANCSVFVARLAEAANLADSTTLQAAGMRAAADRREVSPAQVAQVAQTVAGVELPGVASRLTLARRGMAGAAVAVSVLVAIFFLNRSRRSNGPASTPSHIDSTHAAAPVLPVASSPPPVQQPQLPRSLAEPELTFRASPSASALQPPRARTPVPAAAAVVPRRVSPAPSTVTVPSNAAPLPAASVPAAPPAPSKPPSQYGAAGVSTEY